MRCSGVFFLVEATTRWPARFPAGKESPMIAPRYPGVTYRALAMLRAVAAGRAQVSCSCEPDLFVDGLPCCDQVTARALVHAGLVRPARIGLVGERVPAVLTTAGLDALDTRPEAA
jgi:hypothetical protein